jgi:hypothetical protein
LDLEAAVIGETGLRNHRLFYKQKVLKIDPQQEICINRIYDSIQIGIHNHGVGTGFTPS